MTTLHLMPLDVAAVSSAADGTWLIDLTQAGEKTVIAAAAWLLTLAQIPPEQQRAAWLRQLPNTELAALASAQLGGPDPEVMAELVRRMRELL
ncbi:hypothetical protein [Streptomyces misionensis]|uniref:hypothetical protein n=1 Tax=Streptomyces misionensis TaxID=67331 RepID=UPI0033BF2F18